MTDVQSDLFQACGDENGINANNFVAIANSTKGIIGKPNNYFIDIWGDLNRDLGINLPWDFVPCSEIACCVSYLGGNATKILVMNYAEGMYDLYRQALRSGSNPSLGAFVWFQYGNGVPEHTGRVMGYDSDWVYTVEGNVGGIVVAKRYPINSPYIYAYGYPDYSGQTVNTFTIRSASPEKENLPYYNTPSNNGINNCGVGNSEDGLGIEGANVLNNSTGYSQGRMLEMYYEMTPSASGNPFSIFTNPPEDWISIATANNFVTGTDPKDGAVGVWSNGVVGHVANVETFADNTWWVTHSSYYDYSDKSIYSWLQGGINSTGVDTSPLTRIKTDYLQFNCDKIKFKMPTGYRGYAFEYSGTSSSDFIKRFPTSGWIRSNIEQEIDIVPEHYYRFVIGNNSNTNIAPSDFTNGLPLVGEDNYGWWDFSYLHSSPDYLPDFLASDTSWHLLGFIYPFDGNPTPVPPMPPLEPIKKKTFWMGLRNPSLF